MCKSKEQKDGVLFGWYKLVCGMNYIFHNRSKEYFKAEKIKTIKKKNE